MGVSWGYEALAGDSGGYRRRNVWTSDVVCPGTIRRQTDGREIRQVFLDPPHHLDASDKFFEKYGSGVAFIGRFVPGIRTVISIPCGMAKMNVFKFSIFTFLAMLPITSLYIYLGFKLGSQWEHVDEIVKPYIVPAAVVFLGAFGLYVLLKRWKRRAALNKS